MRLQRLIALFLILRAAPSSIAAGPSQNDRVPLNCEILRRTGECNPQDCIAAGARCVPNPYPYPIRAKCVQIVQNLETSGTGLRSYWSILTTTREVCRGCYCGTAQSLEAAGHRKLIREQRKVATAERTSLKRKVQELEMIDGNCIMTSHSRTPQVICNATQCYEDGIHCIPVSDGRCFMYSREDGKKIQHPYFLFPASCNPCKCGIRRA
jgi:hypothetical protein